MEMKKLETNELETVVGGAGAAMTQSEAINFLNSLPFADSGKRTGANGAAPATPTSPYTIVSNDNLSTIAYRFLGNGTAKVYNALGIANKIANVNLIIPGETIKLHF